MNKGWIVAGVIGFLLVSEVGVRVLPHTAAPDFPRSTLTIQTADGAVHDFNVQVATSGAQLEYGLMFRHYLADDAGMIFLFEPPQVIQMWMKNTIIPLDMVFLKNDGTVSYVAENAKPQSLDVISSPGLASAVIELKGGIAAKLHIQRGDKVKSHDFDVAVAKAPPRAEAPPVETVPADPSPAQTATPPAAQTPSVPDQLPGAPELPSPPAR